VCVCVCSLCFERTLNQTPGKGGDELAWLLPVVRCITTNTFQGGNPRVHRLVNQQRIESPGAAQRSVRTSCPQGVSHDHECSASFPELILRFVCCTYFIHRDAPNVSAPKPRDVTHPLNSRPRSPFRCRSVSRVGTLSLPRDGLVNPATIVETR